MFSVFVQSFWRSGRTLSRVHTFHLYDDDYSDDYDNDDDSDSSDDCDDYVVISMIIF